MGAALGKDKDKVNQVLYFTLPYLVLYLRVGSDGDCDWDFVGCLVGSGVYAGLVFALEGEGRGGGREGEMGRGGDGTGDGGFGGVGEREGLGDWDWDCLFSPELG